MRSVTWTPDPEQVADTIVLTSDRGPWVLVDIQGHEKTLTTPTGVSAPRQMGQTTTGVEITPRVLTLTVGLVADTTAELVTMRRVLAHAMTDEPAVFGTPPSLGSLRYSDVDGAQLDIDGLPLGGPQLVSRDPTQTMEVFDVQIWCPDPRWKAPADVQYDFAEENPGGMEFPVEMPFVIPSGNVEAIVTNEGTVSTPILVRLYGEAVNPRVTLDSTGETLVILGNVAADEYVEIDTAFGQKAVTLVNETTLVRTEALAMLDMTESSFWSLRPGPQVVRFEADSNVSGYAVMFFRPRYMAA